MDTRPKSMVAGVASDFMTECIRPEVEALIDEHGFVPITEDERLAGLLDERFRARTRRVRPLFSFNYLVMKGVRNRYDYIYSPNDRLVYQVVPHIIERLERKAGVDSPLARKPTKLPRMPVNINR